MSAPIGERVRFWRQRRGMTQRVLAGLAGISQPYLANIETGERIVDRRLTVDRLAGALRVSAAELTGEQAGDAGPATRVKDVEILLAADGRHPRVLVVDRRTRRPLLRLTPDGAASFCLLVSAIVSAARRR